MNKITSLRLKHKRIIKGTPTKAEVEDFRTDEIIFLANRPLGHWKNGDHYSRIRKHKFKKIK